MHAQNAKQLLLFKHLFNRSDSFIKWIGLKQAVLISVLSFKFLSFHLKIVWDPNEERLFIKKISEEWGWILIYNFAILFFYYLTFFHLRSCSQISPIHCHWLTHFYSYYFFVYEVFEFLFYSKFVLIKISIYTLYAFHKIILLYSIIDLIVQVYLIKI